MSGSLALGTIQQSNISKYTAHKSWNFLSTSFISNDIKYLRGVYSNTPVVISASSAVGEVQNLDGSYVKNTYIDINHLYYNFYYPYGYISYPINSFNRNLNYECIVYSVPQIKIGDSIKPRSVTLNVIGAADETIILQDNGNYELFDTSITTSSFALSELVYLGFNKEFNQSYVPNYINSNVTYIPGINSTTYTYGYAANFNGSSSLQVKDNGNKWFNSFDNNFAISFWAKTPISSITSTSQSILSKKWDNTLLQAYPFDILFDGTSELIYFKRSDGINTVQLSAGAGITTNPLFGHLVFQKTGSNIEVYYNGVFVSSVLDTIVNKVSNNSQIYIGSANLNYLDSFTGTLDEIRLYDRALTQQEITSLSTLTDTDYSALQTNKVGNVFYEDGIIVYSPYQNELIPSSFGVKDTSISFKSSLDIEQSKYYINVPMENYNVSTNSTLYDITGSLNSFATGSEFTPYITTIGLYDGSYNLVAVAKLGTPIAKRNDIDLYFEVKFDRS